MQYLYTLTLCALTLSIYYSCVFVIIYISIGDTLSAPVYKYKGIVDCIRVILAQEGIQGFYRVRINVYYTYIDIHG